jgi:dihydroceramidase
MPCSNHCRRSCVFIYAIATDGAHLVAGWALPLGLVAFGAATTAYYTSTWDFDFFQAAYASEVTVLVLMSVYWCRRAPDPESSKNHYRLLATALAFYFGGFAFWNIDNGYCTELKTLRQKLPQWAGPFTELHALWHLGTWYVSHPLCKRCTVAPGNLVRLSLIWVGSVALC